MRSHMVRRQLRGKHTNWLISCLLTSAAGLPVVQAALHDAVGWEEHQQPVRHHPRKVDDGVTQLILVPAAMRSMRYTSMLSAVHNERSSMHAQVDDGVAKLTLVPAGQQCSAHARCHKATMLSTLHSHSSSSMHAQS
jgi:hypothetical protein